MLDLGANVTVSGSNLFQFALMGFCYYSIINKNTKPKIGILNIGTENNKGLEFLQEAADLIVQGIEGAIGKKKVTYDFHRLMESAEELKCSEFGHEIVSNMS